MESAVLIRNDALRRRLRQEERPAEIDVEHTLETFLAHIQQVSPDVRGDSGIVHQHVKRAEISLERIQHLLTVGGGRHVTAVIGKFSRILRFELCEERRTGFRLRAAAECHVMPFLRQSLHNSRTDSACAARHQHIASFHLNYS